MVVAAPPFPFGALLERSHTVFVGVMTRVSGSGRDLAVSFDVVRVLRGSAASVPDRLHALEVPTGWHDAAFLVISQGDEYWGAPRPLLQFRQSSAGQISWRGWIAFSLDPQGEGRAPVLGHAFELADGKVRPVTLARAVELVRSGHHKDDADAGKEEASEPTGAVDVDDLLEAVHAAMGARDSGPAAEPEQDGGSKWIAYLITGGAGLAIAVAIAVVIFARLRRRPGERDQA
jgi:hypothetical protein